MQVEVKGLRLWFDVDGPPLVPDGAEMRERPTVVLLHGGPGGYDHSYFKRPSAGSMTADARPSNGPRTAAGWAPAGMSSSLS